MSLRNLPAAGNPAIPNPLEGNFDIPRIAAIARELLSLVALWRARGEEDLSELAHVKIERTLYELKIALGWRPGIDPGRRQCIDLFARREHHFPSAGAALGQLWDLYDHSLSTMVRIDFPQPATLRFTAKEEANLHAIAEVMERAGQALHPSDRSSAESCADAEVVAAITAANNLWLSSGKTDPSSAQEEQPPMSDPFSLLSAKQALLGIVDLAKRDLAEAPHPNRKSAGAWSIGLTR